jgi:hypothetical protein
MVDSLDLGDDEETEKAEFKLAEEPDAEDEKPIAAEEEKKEAEPEVPKWDTSLLDSLIQNFLNTDDEEMLPVLCGYFNKIIGFLLTKEKNKMCEYLFLKTEGDIFDGLMKHMTHHSIALLTIELLQIQIKAEPAKKAGALKTSMYEWENSDQENNDDEGENEGVLTAE